jgi:hypothetical protein
METITLHGSRNTGVFVWQTAGSQPDAEGVLARFALPLPATKAICHYAAFQRHDPMGTVCDQQMIGGAMNRVQGLRITRWTEAIEGGVFAVLELAEGGWHARALDPALSSVCLGEAEMARLAILLNVEPAPATARIVRVDPEIVERNSVADGPAGRTAGPVVTRLGRGKVKRTRN